MGLPNFTAVELAAGSGIAVAGLVGAVWAYGALRSAATSSVHLDLDAYEPARKALRLPRQTYKFNTSVLDDDGDEGHFPGLLILHQIPRGRRTPCIAPFVLKLETFLRIHNIRYEVDFESKEARTLTSPWITLRLEDTVDAQNSFDFLCNEYDIEPDAYLAQEKKAISRAFHATLEYHLYWGILLYRYVNEGIDKFRETQFLPAESLPALAKVREVTDKSAWYHGIGKMEPEEVTSMILADLEAMSRLLGGKEYFFGDAHPSELDSTAFGMLAQMLWTMEDSPYCYALKNRFRNLKDFCWRMRKMFWPDWDNCLWDPTDDDGE